MVLKVKPGCIYRLMAVASLNTNLDWRGGVLRGTYTGQWYTNTKARLSAGTAWGGGGAN